MVSSNNFNSSGNSSQKIPMPFKLVGLGIAGFVGLILLFLIWPFYTVDAGYMGVETWFGAPENVALDPGLHFVLPFVESVHEISVQPQLASTTESASTDDQQTVSTTVAINFSVNPADAVTVWKNYRDISTLESTIIAPIVSNDLKAVTALYDAQELITKRGEVRSEVEQAIRSDLAQYGAVFVSGVNITDFQYSDQYEASIENKQVQQQAALAEQYKLQQVQISAQQQVAQANAQAEAAVAIAQGQAKATVLQATADAEAYKLKQASISPEILSLAAIQKWNGVMPIYLGAGAPMPFVSADMGAAPGAP